MAETKTFARAQMVLRKPVAEVFAAFVDPAITSKFWFSSSTGPLEVGKTVSWRWEMFDVATDVTVRDLDRDRFLAFEWGDPGDTSRVELSFEALDEGATFVQVSESGAVRDDDELLRKAIDQTGGWNLVLAALKAWLEHDIVLRVVADHRPPERPA